MIKFLKKNFLFLTLGIVFAFIFIVGVNADDVNVVVVDDDNCTLDVLDNGERNDKREIMVNINDIKAGKRITGFETCPYNADCDDNSNWIALEEYVSPFISGVGNNEISIGLMVPIEKVKLRATFADYEPMNISYVAFGLTPDEQHSQDKIYGEEAYSIGNYDMNDFTDILVGYRGGDIILPTGCTSNGCLLKVTFTEEDYNAYKDRVDDFNQHHKQDDENIPFMDLASMHNHLETVSTDSVLPYEVDNNLYIETDDNTKSFYLFVNKFISETNRSEFVVGDNKNRILTEDYVGLKIRVDRKYFDEGESFITFTDYNHYKQGISIFYGTPKVQLIVDKIREVALTSTGSSEGMGGIHSKEYTKIVSRDNTNYPISEDFELTIKSFYEQEYLVPIAFKNDLDETVQNVTLELSRFAFGGNANSLLLVDDRGINCRKSQDHPNCVEENIYVSTSYRGVVDTFYTTSDVVPEVIDSFEISDQSFGLEGHFIDNEPVYPRNKDFNPWAVAIFYHDEEVIETKSFNLGELVKVEGFTTDVISNEVAQSAREHSGDEINGIENYDSSHYTYFAYGLGHEKAINKIEYFSEGAYRDGHIEYNLILASKTEILAKEINRISLFLTNGEIKSNEANFPKLTYGVGEGMVFDIDGRVFEELGGEQ